MGWELARSYCIAAFAVTVASSAGFSIAAWVGDRELHRVTAS
jgi:hypothetical protein